MSEISRYRARRKARYSLPPIAIENVDKPKGTAIPMLIEQKVIPFRR